MHFWNKLNVLHAAIMFAFVLVVVFGFSSCENVFGNDDEETDGGPNGATVSLVNPTENDTVSMSDGTTYVVGYDQVSSNNQDPYVIKEDPNGNQIWGYYHDQTSVDARAVLIALDDDERPYVAFTTDGGSNDNTRFQTSHVEDGAFEDAPFGSYGSGGGAKVTVIARLDPDSGKIENGTFLIARLTSGATNTITPSGLGVSGSTVALQVDSRYWPPAAGATQGNWSHIEDPSLFDDVPLRYTFPVDLTEISDVQSVP